MQVEFKSRSEFKEWLAEYNNETKLSQVELDMNHGCYQLSCCETRENTANVMFCNDGRVEVRFW